MNWINRHSLKLSFALIIIISVFTSSNVRFGEERWHKIISHDANGYYAYLPAVFIYHDLNFSFYDEEIKEQRATNFHLNYNYRHNFKGNIVNKYYVGTAIAELPFFLMAHFLSTPLGYENDGFSKIYYLFVNFASIFYLIIGLLYLFKLLGFYQIKKSDKVWTLLAIYLGTHLFYYTVFEAGMSHIYSFAFISMFLYFGKKYFSQPELKSALILSALLGIIALIRPVNLVVLFLLPFVSGGTEKLKNGIVYLFKPYPFRFILPLLLFATIVFIQLLVYKIQTGSFIVYSYSEEGFNFLDPHIIDILFSYKKGLFLYTPLCLVSLIGIYELYKRNKFETYSFIGFFILLSYLLSSWWNWWYGGSFSSRVYVDYLSLFGILLALTFNFFRKNKAYKTFFFIVIFIVIFNQKQTYLYRVAHIHWAEMDKERYWQSTYHPLQNWYSKLTGNEELNDQKDQQ